MGFGQYRPNLSKFQNQHGFYGKIPDYHSMSGFLKMTEKCHQRITDMGFSQFRAYWPKFKTNMAGDGHFYFTIVCYAQNAQKASSNHVKNVPNVLLMWVSVHTDQICQNAKPKFGHQTPFTEHF